MLLKFWIRKTFKRPIYAGNAIATVENKSEKNFLTIRTTAFDAFSFENVRFSTC